MKLLAILLILSFSVYSQKLFVESDESIWRNVVTGKYKVDSKNDRGGLFVTVITDKDERVYIPREFIDSVDSVHSLGVGYPVMQACNSQSLSIFNPLVYASYENSCDNLKDYNVNLKEDMLNDCLQKLKEELNDYKNDYPKLIKKLLSFSPEKRDFLAYILTAYGEGRSEQEEEISLIFKTIDNRARYARRKACYEVGALDVVIQRYQFSMWNRNDPNWKKAVSLKSEEHSEKSEIKRMINIYIKYKNGKYKLNPKKNIDRIYHYRTKNISKVPSWGTYSKAEKVVEVNNKNIGSLKRSSKIAHYFFKNVAWSFEYHPYRKMKKGEESCY